MKEYSIRIGGKPIAWRRPDMRVLVPSGAELMTIARRCHTPQALRSAITKACRATVWENKTHPIADYKILVAAAARARMAGNPPLDGAVSLRVIFRMPRPQAENWKTKPTPGYLHVKKPDLDNLAKGIKDSLNRIAYHDDSQVAIEHFEKWTAAGGEQPQTVITWGKIECET